MLCNVDRKKHSKKHHNKMVVFRENNKKILYKAI